MKKNLGKIVVLLLFAIALSARSDLADYGFHIDKKTIYTKEAVEVTFTATQKDQKDAMFFILNPKPSSKYKIELLTQESKKLSYHNYAATFRFVVFPLVSGDIDVDFDFIIKVASDDVMAQIYTGDYSRVKWVEMPSIPVKIPPLRLHVKPLKEKVDLVGDFKIDSHLQASQTNQYGAANISYVLSGTGYVNDDLKLLENVSGATIFSDIKDEISKYTAQGLKIKRDFSYALIAQKDFVIPALTLKAYSPTKNKYYTLSTQAYPIKITSINPDTLVDDKDFPKENGYDLSTLKNIFIAIIIFLAGFITARLSSEFKFKKVTKKHRFRDIKDAKSPKELIIVLLQNYKNRDIQEYINELERLEYKSSQRSFNAIKEEILKKFM
ncbi:hypothetical protein [Sulfurimonas sp. HSL-1716]|uniref:hypothetical protein n=1 Tax=Hydrocurvibacter sulfurireducens TaxID=3131937 RepID=UPI0031F782A4